MRLSFYKFQGMQSLCKICFFSFISLVAACTVPVRTGYDRELGEYAPPPESTSTTVNLSPSGPDSSIYSDENISPGDLDCWMAVIKPWLGARYKYGGSSKSGTDCSGYVMQIYKEKTGKSLPHSSGALFKMGEKVDLEDLQTGDLVFFGNLWGINHVGIYLSNGNFTHASSSDGVAIIPLSTKYWKKRYRGARRLL